MKSDNTRSLFYLHNGKRFFDLVLTVPVMILVLPVLAIVAFLVRSKLGAPVLFKQVRPGLLAKPFTILKFRTMTEAKGVDNQQLPDQERLTHLGRFLRKTSLDELPELINVLKGDMSLVGPRPLLMQYLDRYTPEQARRHEVKPGVTGWSQVNGRNNVKFSERLKMDVWYVDNLSLVLDFKIIFTTFLYVLRHEDVRSDLDTCLTEVDDCGFYDKTQDKQNGGPDIK